MKTICWRCHQKMDFTGDWVEDEENNRVYCSPRCAFPHITKEFDSELAEKYWVTIDHDSHDIPKNYDWDFQQ